VTVVLDPCDPHQALVDDQLVTVDETHRLDVHRGRLVAVPVVERAPVLVLAVAATCVVVWAVVLSTVVRWVAS